MDPIRFRDDPEQPQALRDLLDHSVRDVGTREEVAQTAAKIAAVIGTGALGTLAASSTAKASIWAGKAWLTASVVVGAVAVTGVAIVVGSSEPTKRVEVPVAAPHVAAPSSIQRPALPPEIVVEAPTPAVEAPKVETPQAAPRTTAAQPTATPSVATPESPPVSSVTPPPNESQLLGAAQSALASDPNRALQLTAEHRRAFPSGAFTQEREVIEIDALYRLGRKAEAERRATQFMARNPGSSYARRVKDLLGR
jgi:hypothetical protein